MIAPSGLRLVAILAAAQPVRGTTAAVTVVAAPKIDGTLDDPLWQKCPPLVL